MDQTEPLFFLMILVSCSVVLSISSWILSISNMSSSLPIFRLLLRSWNCSSNFYWFIRWRVISSNSSCNLESIFAAFFRIKFGPDFSPSLTQSLSNLYWISNSLIRLHFPSELQCLKTLLYKLLILGLLIETLRKRPDIIDPKIG